jgi:hypothetical protein
VDRDDGDDRLSIKAQKSGISKPGVGLRLTLHPQGNDAFMGEFGGIGQQVQQRRTLVRSRSFYGNSSIQVNPGAFAL